MAVFVADVSFAWRGEYLTLSELGRILKRLLDESLGTYDLVEIIEHPNVKVYIAFCSLTDGYMRVRYFYRCVVSSFVETGVGEPLSKLRIRGPVELKENEVKKLKQRGVVVENEYL